MRAHGEVDGHIVCAIVGFEAWRGERSEDDGSGGWRKSGARFGLQLVVEDEEEEGDEDEVYGGRDRGTGGVLACAGENRGWRGRIETYTSGAGGAEAAFSASNELLV